MTIDEEYLAALDANDMDRVQTLIALAASNAVFTIGPVFHGTPAVGFNQFEIKKSSVNGGFGVWFGGTQAVGEKFARARFAGKEPGVISAYIRLDNPKVYDGWSSFVAGMESTKRKELGDMHRTLRRRLDKSGFDGIIIKDCDTDNAGIRDDYAVFDVAAIKLADAVVRDDSGNIILPSRRFARVSDLRGSTIPALELAGRVETVSMAATARQHVSRD